ncbi:MAG: CocE/NonD family hydrolase [Acidimicrobiales bacterium]|nr:CocE/NonD family hydrolase [Acidimicrobiales bacterium]
MKVCASAVMAVALLLASCSGSSNSSEAGSTTTTAAAGKRDGGTGGGQPTDLPVQVDPDQPTAQATFDVSPGTETVTVTGAEPGERMSLVDRDGKRLIILRTDKFGQAHFAYIPTELLEFQTGGKAQLPSMDGTVVEAGDGYTIRAEDRSPVQVSDAFKVLGRDDNPPGSFFDQQAGDLVPPNDQTQMFGYVTTRDGVKLSVMVRLPGPPSKGPYPTVIEYSGYGPSNPGATEPGSMIAGFVGYASVGVNMRGTGCSGGVFDVFNTAQQVDGYDAVEAIARQPWVKDHKVGMVGLSYSGITQLYTAATDPPSLAGVTSLSVIKDPWLEQWPGGVYNGGFTKQWLSERDSQSAAGGTTWVQKRIDEGDTTCEEHQKLREQNIDFEAFGRSLEHRPAQADGRDLSKLVSKIKVPVYLSGAWQDEQTGPQFADMLGNFTSTPVHKFVLFNGRHPDGYTPFNLSRWYEFLELYVNHKVPKLDPAIRALAPAVFEQFFHIPGLEFAPDRFESFTPDQYEEAKAWYEATPDVHVMFDVGADAEHPGKPTPSYTKDYETWPPAGIATKAFYLDANGALSDVRPRRTGVDRFLNDPDSASKTFFAPDPGYELLAPTWTFDWTDFAPGNAVSYVSKPFAADTVLGGPGYAELEMRVPDGDADVQVSLSLIDTAGTEWHVTTGLLRLSDRKIASTDGLRIDRTFSVEDSEPMPAGKFEVVKVALPSFAQTFRKGDRLKVEISGPGRDFGAWAFEAIGDEGTPRDITRGAGQASRLMLGVLPGITDIPDVVAACPSLRGQACRTYEARTNTPAE